MKNILPLSAEDFGLFQELLVATSGLYFEESRSQFLHLALWQRLQHRGYDSYREYYNLLKFHPEGRLEIRELLDLITIGETYFFRNKAQFDVLMKFVLPEIMQRKIYSRDKSIRVWSAGCSGGDEAYSIAIAIMEVIPFYEEWGISILGTDINRNALACAEEAIYGEKSIAHLPKEYLGKYFEARGSTYILKTNVRELVQFEYHNLAKDPFIHEKMRNIDIIFCRNVIIYFDAQTTCQVIENFYDCLVQDGYLFLGHAETLWQITNKFEGVEFPQTFTYKKRLSPVREDAMKPFMAVPEIKLENLTLSAAPIPVFESRENRRLSELALSESKGSTLSEPPPSDWGVEGLTSFRETNAEKRFFSQESSSGLQEKPEPLEQVGDSTLRVEKRPELKEKLESAYKKATLCLEEIKDRAAAFSPHNMIAQDKNYIRTYLNQATLLANEAKYKEAAEALAKVIEVDNLSVEAYYLLGVLSYKSGDLKEAQTQFRKVIYVDPNSVLAYFNLGNMYLYQRKFSEAAREFRNAIRLLEKRPKDEQVKFCEDFTVEFLLRACRNNLAEISRRGERYE
jgi:chemotaxis protein methyltransferase CheR